MFIINPLSGQGMDNLFSTHPSTANRIAALEKLAAEMGQSAGSAVPETNPGPWSDPQTGDKGPWD